MQLGIRKIMLPTLCFFLIQSCGGPTLRPGTPSSEIPEQRAFLPSDRFSPCEDFYQHACSNAVAEFKLRDDRSYHVFSFHDSSERLLEAKKSFLKKLSTPTSSGQHSKRRQSLSVFYQACMNEDASKQEEKSHVSETLKRLDKIQSRENFLNLIAANIERPEISFVGLQTIPNFDQPDNEDVFFISSLMSLPERSYYANPEIIAAFRDILISFFQTIGLSSPEKRADTVIRFESEFAKSFPLPREFRELTSKRNFIDRASLIEKNQSLRLAQILKKIPDHILFRDLTPDNLRFVDQALESWPLSDLKDVFLYHELDDYLDDAYPEYFQKIFQFRKKFLGGPEQRPVREERCTKLVMANFAKEIDAELLPEIFPNFDESKIKEIAERIRSSILVGLKKNTWLSPTAKRSAIKKIAQAKLKLVKPKTSLEWDFNPEISYQTNTPYKNSKLLKVALFKKMLKELAQKRNRDRWSMGPLTVNAYYSRTENTFVLPQGILQPPFYDPSLSIDANLGGVGAVIGHELGHAIDDQGSKYDEQGRLTPWMSDADLKEFQKRSASLVGQFQNAGHDGKLTLGENIGDLVGVTFALEATQSKDPAIQRAFFYQWARTWCHVIRPGYRDMLIKTDPHAMGEARVNEPLKHQATFAQAFSCKVQPLDPMVFAEKDRVHIW